MSLAKQLVWTLGLKLEIHLDKLMYGKLRQPDMNARFREFSEDMGNMLEINRHLVRYVESGRLASLGRTMVSCCLDKGSVGGLSLLDTVFSFPDNVAICAPPQVDSLLTTRAGLSAAMAEWIS